MTTDEPSPLDLIADRLDALAEQIHAVLLSVYPQGRIVRKWRGKTFVYRPF